MEYRERIFIINIINEKCETFSLAERVKAIDDLKFHKRLKNYLTYKKTGSIIRNNLIYYINR